MSVFFKPVISMINYFQQLNIVILLNILAIFISVRLTAQDNPDYEQYHQAVAAAEKLMVAENYREALQVYEQLFNNYDFIFLQEYQISTQLAWYLNEQQKAINYLKKGMLAGWELKSIRKNKYLSPLRKGKNWKLIKKEYPKLNSQYRSNLNLQLRERLKKMFRKDQRKAIRAFFTFGEKTKARYAEKKFAPHSERQMAELSEILSVYGYPGEKLIGNNFWASTILSHHNSISEAYVKKDRLYPNLKPALKAALKKGQISPFEFALIDDWHLTVKSDRTVPTYGILDPIASEDLSKVNERRKTAFLSLVEIRNGLVDIQKKKGIDFYLPGHTWLGDKIKIN